MVRSGGSELGRACGETRPMFDANTLFCEEGRRLHYSWNSLSAGVPSCEEVYKVSFLTTSKSSTQASRLHNQLQ
jgi:hypothetical protein